MEYAKALLPRTCFEAPISINVDLWLDGVPIGQTFGIHTLTIMDFARRHFEANAHEYAISNPDSLIKRAQIQVCQRTTKKLIEKLRRMDTTTNSFSRMIYTLARNGDPSLFLSTHRDTDTELVAFHPNFWKYDHGISLMRLRIAAMKIIEKNQVRDPQGKSVW